MGNLAAETKQQAASLLDTVRSEVGQQAGTQQQRIAEAVRNLSTELDRMASSSQESGPLTDLARRPPQGWRDRRVAAGQGAGGCLGLGPVLCSASSGNVPGSLRPGGCGGRTDHPRHRDHPNQPGLQGRQDDRSQQRAGHQLRHRRAGGAGVDVLDRSVRHVGGVQYVPAVGPYDVDPEVRNPGYSSVPHTGFDRPGGESTR